MNKEKELENIYQKQYEGAGEENRLICSKAYHTEYILTMHYIHKYIKPKSKVIDIGAGAGIYTQALANEGHFIDAIDLHSDNVNKMKEKFDEINNISVYQSNALNLNQFVDNYYDFVLLLGPVYHIHNLNDRIQAIAEAVRVANKGTPIFVAFILQDSPLIEYIFQSDNPAEEICTIGYDKLTARVTENTGSSIFLDTIDTVDEVVDKACETLPVIRGPRFAQNGLSHVIRDYVNAMSDDSYNEWIQYMIATAERQDLMGYSNHIVQIFIKK